MANLAAADSLNAIVQPNGRMRDRFRDWLSTLVQRANDCAHVIGRVTLVTQSAAIASTAIPLPVLTTALYRVSLTARITRAASVSSSLIVTISWTSGGVLCSVATAALTGNTTASVQTVSYLLAVDANTTINYSTTYASVGGTTMQHDLRIRVEAVPD